jgi:glycosyltransferase Alg8
MAGAAEHRGRSPRGEAVLLGAGWAALLAALISLLPERVLTAGDAAFLATLGALGIWRWAWAGLHLLRAWAYTRRIFPMIRARAEADAALRGRHVAVVILSWKMGDAMNAAVYGNLFRDILDNGGGGTVVAAVSSPQDMALIAHVLRRLDPAGTIRLAFTLQDGSGKRAAMADALARLRELGVPPDCPGILMDGDTLVAPGLIRACAPILLHQPRVGALTVDNVPLVAGSTLAREWYRLRMAQRQVMMASMAVSGRVLVLTGRWSMFRSQILTDPNFAANLLEDVIHHPRLGRIAMLTGDDKSTWRWVVEHGWEVTYVPDRVIHCLEALPGKGFLTDTINLQRRWFGNMVRGGIKALALGRQRLGGFTWLALWDQRVSSWTPLIGLLFFAIAGLVHDPVFLLVFAVWIGLTRTLHSALVGLVAGRWHPLFAPLTYYGQIVGAAIKVFVWFNPNVQKWTRQKTGGAGADAAARPRADSLLLMTAAVLVFAAAVAWASGVWRETRRFDLAADTTALELIYGR